MSDIQGVSGAVNEAALRALMERTGYPIEQKSGTGQRIYGPPPQGHPLRENGQPGRGCEVFVGKLPRDCFEDELVPILERCGPLYEVRMMMDFTGSNRGFCFATYSEAECARRATRELNNYEIRPGCHIGVCQSVDNCRLFLGGIPRDKQRQHILEAISKLVSDVKDVIVKPDPKEKHKNRGFAFVEFYSHHSAAMARRKLAVKKVRMWDQEIAVDWAEPEPEIDKEIMDKVKVLYFYNLTLSTTEQAIEKLCVELLGKSGVVERVRKLKDYAFVHFKEREDAIKVMEDMDGKTFDGSAIKITLAKPAEKKAQLKTPQPIQAPGLLVTPNGTILLQQSLDPAALANSKEASLRNPLVMGVKDGSKGRARGAGGIGKVYSRSSSLKRPNMEQLKLTPLNEFVSGNPVLLSATQVKSAVQALEEALRVRGLGSPQYEVTTSGAGDDTSFFSRVYLQSLNLVFQNNRACKYKEESCEQAAFLALKMIEERMPLMPVIPQYCPAIFPGGAHPAGPSILPINSVMMERIPHHEYILPAPYIPTNGSQIIMAPQALMVRPAVEGQLEMSPNFYPVVQNGYILGQVDDNNNHTFSINQPAVVPMMQQPYNILLPLAPSATNATLQVPVSHNA